MEDGKPYLATLIYKKKCPTCGTDFTAKRSNQKYCCHRCAKLSRKHAEGSGRDIMVKVGGCTPQFNIDTGKIFYKKVCLYCGKEFTAQQITTKYCSKECSRKYSLAKTRLEKGSRSDEQTFKYKVANTIMRYSNKEYLRISEASELLGVSEKTIRRYVATKELPSIRTKRIILVPTSSLVTMYVDGVNATGKSSKEIKCCTNAHRYLSITEAAAVFDIKRTTIAHYFCKRKLYFKMIGHVRHFRCSDIEKLIEDFRPNQYPAIKHWYSVDDIMSIYSMDRKHVYWFTGNHKIPHKKSGKKALYSKSHVDRIKGPSLFDRSEYCQPNDLCDKYNLSKDRLYHIIKLMSVPTIRFGREVWILKSAFDGIIS